MKSTLGFKILILFSLLFAVYACKKELYPDASGGRSILKISDGLSGVKKQYSETKIGERLSEKKILY